MAKFIYMPINSVKDSLFSTSSPTVISYPLDKAILTSVQAAVTGTLSMAERSYLMSEVRGRSREDPMPKGRWPRGVTPRPRSWAVAERSNPMSQKWWLHRCRRA